MTVIFSYSLVDPKSLPSQAGVDYTSQFQAEVTFTQGSFRECLNIPITDDNVDERTENFLVTAQSSDSTVIQLFPGEENTEVCIRDDDGNCCTLTSLLIHLIG